MREIRNPYGAPSTYTRIVPHRGCGFILKSIYELTELNPNREFNPTKQDVYRGTKWYGRPGYASLLWGSLVRDGLIATDDGYQEYNPFKSMYHHGSPNRRDIRIRAAGHNEPGRGYTVRYHLTPKGHGILFDMMARVGKTMNGKTLNSVGSVVEYDAKKDWSPKVEDWRDDDFLEPGETKNEWMARHDVTPMKAPPTPAERDILQKEALDCAKLAADYAGENQKHREKNRKMNERLAKLAERLETLYREIALIHVDLIKLIEQNSDKE